MADPALARARKKCAAEGRTPVFVDESGFRLLPAVVRTWAPCDETPILYEYRSRYYLSAISGITPSGRICIKLHEDTINRWGVICFLEHLSRHLPGRLLVLWDRNRIHSNPAVDAFLASPAGAHIDVEELPAYAPDVNPDEDVWHELEYVELKNVVCHDRHHLRVALRSAVMRLRNKPHRIQSFIGKLDHH